MQLAQSGEPLRLADGSLVYPDGTVKKPARQYVEVPSHSEAQRIVTSTRRKLLDMPAPPKTMNAVGIILTYTLFGLEDDEIAVAVGTDVDVITRIRKTPAYKQMQDVIVQSIIENEGADIRTQFARMAKKAAQRVEELVESDDEQIALAASKDALDRGGHRPADIVLHKHSMEGELTIVHLKRDVVKGTDGMVIDMELEQ